LKAVVHNKAGVNGGFDILSTPKDTLAFTLTRDTFALA
jgi:hypothetical protein